MNDTTTRTHDFRALFLLGQALWPAHWISGLRSLPLALLVFLKLLPLQADAESSVLQREGEIGTGIASLQNVIATPHAWRPMTASRTPNGEMRAFLWELGYFGDLTILDADLGGAVQDLSLAVPRNTFDAALAVITGGGNLKIIAYDLSSHTLTRTAEHNSNLAQAVVASPAPFSDGIMTAVRTQSGNFKLIAWRVDPQAGTILRLADADGGAVQALSLVAASGFEGVIAAVVTGSGKLKLLTFDVPFGGFAVQRADEFLDGDINAVSIARLGLLPNGEDLVVTASRTDAGNLELISWSIDWQGNITRLGDAQAGAIGEVSASSFATNHVTTAVTTGSGNLKHVVWNVAEDGTITRLVDLEAGAASAVAHSGAAFVLGMLSIESVGVTAISDSSGELKLIAIVGKLSN